MASIIGLSALLLVGCGSAFTANDAAGDAGDAGAPSSSGGMPSASGGESGGAPSSSGGDTSRGGGGRGGSAATAGGSSSGSGGRGGGGATSGSTSGGGGSGGAVCLADWKGSSCDTCSSSAMPAGCSAVLHCGVIVLQGGGTLEPTCTTNTDATAEAIRIAKQVYACRCP